MATFVKAGYGQVEFNHMSAPATGQIFADLIWADENSIGALENGMFLKYDKANGEMNLTGPGEWMLVSNEVKLYDIRQYYKDFAMKVTDAVDGEVFPRVYKTNVGDMYTTNMITNGTYVLGDRLVVDSTTGVLKKAVPAAGEMVWQVVKVYTMADGEAAVKLMRLPNAVA